MIEMIEKDAEDNLEDTERWSLIESFLSPLFKALGLNEASIGLAL